MDAVGNSDEDRGMQDLAMGPAEADQLDALGLPLVERQRPSQRDVLDELVDRRRA